MPADYSKGFISISVSFEYPYLQGFITELQAFPLDDSLSRQVQYLLGILLNFPCEAQKRRKILNCNNVGRSQTLRYISFIYIYKTLRHISSPARVVGRALSKWTLRAPKPGSYWGTQGQVTKEMSSRGTPPTVPAATLLIPTHSRPSPGQCCLTYRKHMPTAHAAPLATSTNPMSHCDLCTEQLLSTCHGTAPEGRDRDIPDKHYNSSITASTLEVLPH